MNAAVGTHSDAQTTWASPNVMGSVETVVRTMCTVCGLCKRRVARDFIQKWNRVGRRVWGSTKQVALHGGFCLVIQATAKRLPMGLRNCH